MTQEMARWVERHFPNRPPANEFPMIVERLRGTPDRVEKKASALPVQLLTAKPENVWSIQEHIGHLIDLEPLWTSRLTELLTGTDTLTAADMTNRKTNEANHNARPVSDLIGAFRGVRLQLVSRLDQLETEEVEASAQHPRLGQQMRTIDLCLFVAEHDDHHLALMTRLLRQIAGV
jgi:uncharacterized damage-inducible protein DinB